MTTPGKETRDTVKTSVALPRKLWKAAHMRALDEDLDLQDVIAAAIAAYLKTPKAQPGGKRR